jgi:hypothetical protein
MIEVIDQQRIIGLRVLCRPSEWSSAPEAGYWPEADLIEHCGAMNVYSAGPGMC